MFVTITRCKKQKNKKYLDGAAVISFIFWTYNNNNDPLETRVQHNIIYITLNGLCTYIYIYI